ncbi:MAG: hypothetical protein JNL67_03840 [Planctomycetaceae bacterium]|nr:hypothetical protein [Planctomycetaceae bacterium]
MSHSILDSQSKESRRRVRLLSGFIAILAILSTPIVPFFAMSFAFSKLKNQQPVEASRLAEAMMWAMATIAIPMLVAVIAIGIWFWARRS